MFGKRALEESGVVDIGKEGTVEVIGWELSRNPVSERRVEERSHISSNNDDDRSEQQSPPTIVAGRVGSSRVSHCAGSQQHEAVETVCLQLLLDPLLASMAHPRQVWINGDCGPFNCR